MSFAGGVGGGIDSKDEFAVVVCSCGGVFSFSGDRGPLERLPRVGALWWVLVLFPYTFAGKGFPEIFVGVVLKT